MAVAAVLELKLQMRGIEYSALGTERRIIPVARGSHRHVLSESLRGKRIPCSRNADVLIDSPFRAWIYRTRLRLTAQTVRYRV